MPKAIHLSKEQIQAAMNKTKSVRAAARYLNVSYQHLKKWMKLYKDENGNTLFEAHKNQSGKGIPKFLPNRRKEPNVKNIVETGMGWESFTPDKIKTRIITEGYLVEECHMCGMTERRITDYKIPLLMNFKDGNKYNYLLSNLELLCYNCYFLYVADPLTPDQVRHIEDNTTVKSLPHTFDLDEAALENMKALGLLD